MKKNITIHLSGQLFAIDEDAYELLYNYTETLRRYYRHQSEGEEVVDDIEARIAELFSEKISLGYNAICIDHVRDVIQRIGNLEDIASAETGSTYSYTETAQPDAAEATEPAEENGIRGAWNKVRSGKRFYRDSENKIIAGVLAGCAKYFGGDALFWRLAFLLLAFVPIPFLDELHGITGTLVILYIILSVIAPATATPEDVLKMRGEEINPQNLAEEVTRQTAMASANNARQQRRQTLKVIAAVLLILASVWALVGFLATLGVAAAAWFVPQFIIHEFASDLDGNTEFVSTITNGFTFLLGSVSAFLFVSGYCLMHTGLNLLDKVRSMSFGERIVWFILWGAALICIIISAISFGYRVNDADPWEDVNTTITTTSNNDTITDITPADTVEAFGDMIEE